jgi:hypothetical protein
MCEIIADQMGGRRLLKWRRFLRLLQRVDGTLQFRIAWDCHTFSLFEKVGCGAGVSVYNELWICYIFLRQSGSLMMAMRLSDAIDY